MVFPLHLSHLKSTNSVIYLIFDVKIGAGLAEDLHNTRETVPHSNVETRLLMLRVDKQKLERSPPWTNNRKAMLLLCFEWAPSPTTPLPLPC
jgi:hypothetical protein